MANLGERFAELCDGVLAPLVLGGNIALVRPFGARLAMTIGQNRDIPDSDLRNRLDVARVRRARLYAPVDTVADLDAGDWAMLCGLNDLLQITNHELGGAFTRGRYRTLLFNVVTLAERLPAPRTIAAALSRHATFARVLEVARTDSTVSWWTGSAKFRGSTPPTRLLRWRELRRVNVDARKVMLSDMSAGVSGVEPRDFHEALGLWLTRSPLTDIATLARRAPPFAWSASTLSLIATPPGRALAFRAVARTQHDQAAIVLTRAAKEIPPRYEEAHRLVDAFTVEALAGLKVMAEPAVVVGSNVARGLPSSS